MNTYNKLVRDKIPEICQQSGYTPRMRTIENDEEYLAALCDKLGEEAQEVKDGPSVEELADVLEVLLAIGKAIGLTPDQIEAARMHKTDERGAFDDRVFLISTEPQ